MSLVEADPVGFDESADSRLALFGRIDAERETLIGQNVMFRAHRFGGEAEALLGGFRTEVGHLADKSGSSEGLTAAYDHSNRYLWVYKLITYGATCGKI